VKGVHNYKRNGAQVQLQIFPVSPVHYIPKLGFPRHFSGQQEVCIIDKYVLYMEDYWKPVIMTN